MTTVERLEELQHRALQDPALREELLATRQEPDAYAAFCKKSQALAEEITPKDLIMAAAAFNASDRRSTNGGGENSPKLEGEDDFYEMFFAALEA
ncbi:MAG: hypothetical protein LUF34_07315 [Lachnospiraceae bacterium]|nr:hypothetical protein [Lachnospiraceae bacterium]